MRDRRRFRAARRAAEAGFTLIELLVVVLLIATLAIIAVPAMKTSREDRQAFDYARQYSLLMHRAAIRATARGAAHLVLINASGIRGNVRLFEAWGPVPPKPAYAAPSPPYKQESSCKVPNQWLETPGWAVGTATTFARIVEGVDLDTAGVNADMNIMSTALLNGTAQAFIALCYTPGGNVYAGASADGPGAISAMQQSLPFTGAAEVRIRRRDAANATLGITRRVIVGGAAAPRIQAL